MPSQKPGTAMKRIDSARATPSGTLFGLNALRMPTGRPTSHETNSASTPISALIGPRCAISSETVSPRKNDLPRRSEEHTSELQSRFDLVCRLLLEKKKETNT